MSQYLHFQKFALKTAQAQTQTKTSEGKAMERLIDSEQF